jgi:uncharacterized protein YwgA
MKQKLSNDFILLLMLYVDEQSKISGRTRLQKMIFLYEKECQKSINQTREPNLFDFDFFPHHYGPFSKELYKHLKNLKTFGMITIENESHIEDENCVDKETQYCITQDGILTVQEEILQQQRINQLEIEMLNTFKKEYNNMNLNELIKLVYEKYPDYTNNSKIKDKVLG